MNVDQVAHDLAIAYINNRFGAEITGTFTVSSSTNYDNDTVRDVVGEGTVTTERHPGPYDPELVRVGTGARSLFGIGPEKTRLEPTGAYAVDDIFRSMIDEYEHAFQRLVQLLQQR